MKIQFLYLRNDWVDYVQTSHVVQNLKDECLAQELDGASLYIRTCAPLFHISGMAGQIELKFCLWLFGQGTMTHALCTTVMYNTFMRTYVNTILYIYTYLRNVERTNFAP